MKGHKSNFLSLQVSTILPFCGYYDGFFINILLAVVVPYLNLLLHFAPRCYRNILPPRIANVLVCIFWKIIVQRV